MSVTSSTDAPAVSALAAIEDSLTPTQELVLFLLASQHRLGLRMVLLSSRHRHAVGGLADAGLVGHQSGSTVHGADKVWLTEAGLVVAMDPMFRPPVQQIVCGSWYAGSESHEHRVDCVRRNHHKGKHRGYRYVHRDGEIRNEALRWEDTEQRGLVSALYGPTLRRIEAERRRRLEDAIETYRPGTRVEEYL